MTSREISVLRELAKKKKIAKELSLNDKLTRQHGQATLQEIYKPMLESQETQKEEQLTKQQQTIEEIRRSQASATEELRKQQLIIPLIKSLAKHKNIIQILKGEHGDRELTEDEKHILKELSHIDNKTLLTLIDYFKDNEKDKDEVFGTPGATTPQPTPSDAELPEYTKIPTNITTNAALGEWLIKDIVAKRNLSAPDRNRKQLETLLNKGLENRSAAEIKDGLLAYMENLVANNIRVNLGEYPWTTIKVVDPILYDNIRKIKTPNKSTKRRMTQSSTASTPRGTGATAFLTSDPSELVKRLEILHAEKLAGNNNVLTEASAIADELRRQGVINTETLKKMSNLFC